MSTEGRGYQEAKEIERLRGELEGAKVVIADLRAERNEALKGIARLTGLLHEVKLAFLDYPMSMRTHTPSTLLQAINAELGESKPSNT